MILLQYVDDEGDKVLLGTDSDLVAAVNFARISGWKVSSPRMVVLCVLLTGEGRSFQQPRTSTRMLWVLLSNCVSMKWLAVATKDINLFSFLFSTICSDECAVDAGVDSPFGRTTRAKA